MSILHSQESEYAKERRKHEAHHSEFGAPGRPYVFHEYPTMMYKAGLNERSQVDLLAHEVAENETQRSSLEALGYTYGGPGKAVEAFEKQRQALAQEAAERNYRDQHMSDKAKAESAEVESKSSEHLGAIPPAHPKTGRRD